MLYVRAASPLTSDDGSRGTEVTARVVDDIRCGV